LTGIVIFAAIVATYQVVIS